MTKPSIYAFDAHISFNYVLFPNFCAGFLHKPNPEGWVKNDEINKRFQWVLARSAHFMPGWTKIGPEVNANRVPAS